MSEGRGRSEVLAGHADFEAIEASGYNLSPADRRTVRSIIFQHFDYIVSEWKRFQEQKDG